MIAEKIAQNNYQLFLMLSKVSVSSNGKNHYSSLNYSAIRNGIIIKFFTFTTQKELNNRKNTKARKGKLKAITNNTKFTACISTIDLCHKIIKLSQKMKAFKT